MFRKMNIRISASYVRDLLFGSEVRNLKEAVCRDVHPGHSQIAKIMRTRVPSPVEELSIGLCCVSRSASQWKLGMDMRRLVFPFPFVFDILANQTLTTRPYHAFIIEWCGVVAVLDIRPRWLLNVDFQH